MPDRSLVVDNVRCNFCGTIIPKVFARAAVPVTNSHRPASDPHTHTNYCRVIVVIDPLGNDHQIHRVPEGVSERTVLQRLMEAMRAAA